MYYPEWEMLRHRSIKLVLAGALVFAGVEVMALNAMAAADESVTVQIDQAKIYRLASPAGTIIIGNPAIADATLQDSQTLIITGHSYGQTNLIVLDSEGETISDSQVIVDAPSDKLVTVFKGASRFSYSCMPDCQPTAIPGDQSGHFNGILGQVSAHDGAGAGRGATTATTATTGTTGTTDPVPQH